MKQRKSPVYMVYIIIFACFLRAAVLKHFYSLRLLKRLEHYLLKSVFQVFFVRFINTKIHCWKNVKLLLYNEINNIAN